jgi:hypothetical protein
MKLPCVNPNQNRTPTLRWRNQVESRLLVVRSQIANLTPGLSFGHNLCFKCPNGQCKTILDIYVSISFQWYLKIFKKMGFDPCNCAVKIREFIWNSNPEHGSSLRSVRVHSLKLFAFSGACDVTPGSPSWFATLQPLSLVVSPRLRWRKTCSAPHLPSKWTPLICHQVFDH